MWQLDKEKSKKDVILEAETEKRKVHFATLMDISKMPSRSQGTQKYEGRIVLRGVEVEDDSGAFALFTERGSSASQMTAATVMNVNARLPDCEGKAAGAVSAKWRTLRNW